MRRSTRFGLIAAAVILVIVIGGYTAFWLIAAGRIEAGIGPWARSLRAHNLDLTWRTAAVRGFPLAFRLELADAQLHERDSAMPGKVRVPLLAASAAPWNFRVWHLDAANGLSAAAGPGDHPLGRVAVKSADGAIVVADAGGLALWFGASDPTVDAGMQLTARQIYLWLTVPAHPPESHTEPAVGVALDVWALSLPIVPSPLRNPLDELSFGLTLKGKIPSAPLREAAQAWRDAGGTVDLDSFALRWGALAIRGSGTAALDAELQPTGAFSGAIEGYPELMRALVSAGRIRRSDAGIADMALALLSRPGPDGRPAIATSFAIQDGEMFLGPAKLGPAPRIAW